MSEINPISQLESWGFILGYPDESGILLRLQIRQDTSSLGSIKSRPKAIRYHKEYPKGKLNVPQLDVKLK